MDVDALNAFINHIEANFDDRKYIWFGEDDEVMGETATRPIQLSYLAYLSKLSNGYSAYKLRKKEENQKEAEKEEEEEGMKLEVVSDNDSNFLNTPPCFHFNPEDLPSEPHDSVATGSSMSSTEGLIFGISNLLVKTFCKNFLRRTHLQPWDLYVGKKGLRENALRTTTLIEFKDDTRTWAKGPGGVFQAASYAIIEGVQNFNRGRRKPIYLLLWEKKHWCFGTLLVEGSVKVTKDGVVETDLQLSEWSKLNNQLNMRENELKEYLSDKSASYNDTYVVGKLSINRQVFDFPWADGNFTNDVSRFYQSILRLTLGDSVLQIKEEDVKEIIKIIKEKEMQRLVRREKFAPIRRAMINLFREEKRQRKI